MSDAVVRMPRQKTSRLSRTTSTGRPPQVDRCGSATPLWSTSGRSCSAPAASRCTGPPRAARASRGRAGPSVASKAVAQSPSSKISSRRSLMKSRQLVVVLLQPDAVGLVAEGCVDELVGALARLDQAGEDRVVGGDGLHPAVAERLGALRVRVEERDLGLGRGRGKVRGGGRALDGADLLAVEVLDARDRVVVGLDHDVLLRDEVRPGEVDHLLARVVDRVGRDHDVDGAVLDERLAVAGHRLHPLDVDVVPDGRDDRAWRSRRRSPRPRPSSG